MVQQAQATVTPMTTKKKFTASHIVGFHKKSDKQHSFIEKYHQYPDTILHIQDGSAGTGKTTLALHLALEELAGSRFEKIIIVNSCVQGRNIGFLPGSKDEKEQEYELKYRQMVNEMLSSDFNYDELKNRGLIEFHSTSFLRGMTFNNAIIIVDEFQNMNYQEIFSTVLTRVGIDTKVILCGDRKQCDLENNKDRSGFARLFHVLRHTKPNTHQTTVYTPSDIVRSDFVKDLLIAEESAEYEIHEKSREMGIAYDEYVKKNF